MPPPTTPYEAVLHAARDVAELDCALDAEMLGGALLGSVYAIAEDDRADAVRDFVGGFLAATGRRRTSAATTIRQVFAALVPEAAGAAEVRPGPQSPPWVGQLGRVRLTGSYAYGDVYGDQTSYLATFAYDGGDSGGPEHAVVALVDHNIGIAKDIFVGGPAEQILDRVRELCDSDELTWFRIEEPGRLRTEVARHLEITDGLTELPADSSVATDRALLGARLTVLPASGTPPLEEPARPREPILSDFLASPEASRFGLAAPADVDLPSRDFCLSLVFDHADTLPEPDPLRFSPTVAELFMLDWVHRRAVLDDDDAAMLPRVARAWAAYAARTRGLPDAAAAEIDAALEKLGPEFAKVQATGERRSPATAAVAQLIAEGVDPSDPGAIDTWLAANRDKLS